MGDGVSIAVAVAMVLLLIVAVCAVDRWIARRLARAMDQLVLAVDDPTPADDLDALVAKEMQNPAFAEAYRAAELRAQRTSTTPEEGGVEPAVIGLDLAAEEAIALLAPAVPQEPLPEWELELLAAYDAVPTLREERIVLPGHEMRHVCLPDCPHRTDDQHDDGPVVQGRRCPICLGPTDGGTWDCDRCFTADDVRAVRRADR